MRHRQLKTRGKNVQRGFESPYLHQTKKSGFPIFLFLCLYEYTCVINSPCAAKAVDNVFYSGCGCYTFSLHCGKILKMIKLCLQRRV